MDKISEWIVDWILFRVSQTNTRTIEINANYFKTKRKLNEISSQYCLSPFGDFENGDPARTNPGRGEYFADEKTKQKLLQMRKKL